MQRQVHLRISSELKLIHFQLNPGPIQTHTCTCYIPFLVTHSPWPMRLETSLFCHPTSPATSHHQSCPAQQWRHWQRNPVHHRPLGLCPSRHQHVPEALQLLPQTRREREEREKERERRDEREREREREGEKESQPPHIFINQLVMCNCNTRTSALLISYSVSQYMLRSTLYSTFR